MWSSLLFLLAKCTHDGCAAQVNPANMKTSISGIALQADILCTNSIAGAAIRVAMTCNDGHETEWSSSNTIRTTGRRLYSINVSLIVYTLLSGIHFDQIKVLLCFETFFLTKQILLGFFQNDECPNCIRQHFLQISEACCIPSNLLLLASSAS